MAIMVPRIPKDYTPESKEDLIFHALEKLSDDYYVFHSFKMLDIIDSVWSEREIDFLVFNKEKGILVIEAKAGAVRCEQGIWKYGSGEDMKRSPFEQAQSAMYRLQKTIEEDLGNKEITNRCKMLFAVWFPSIDKKGVDKITLPLFADRELIMTKEDLDDPCDTIEHIFSINRYYNHKKGTIETGLIQTNLTQKEKQFLINNIFCQTFNIAPAKTSAINYKHEIFNELIKEQSNLLNYLEDQKSAVINGAAGTGKTMIALEKARRHSVKGEKVLFLCYNTKLKDYLSSNYKYDNVDYYTIIGYIYKMCGSGSSGDDLLEELLEMSSKKDSSFPYDHVIVDEGQDFGQDNIPSDEIFEVIEDMVLKKENGSFYIFYDKNQFVQGKKIPEFIENADCRLTLYKNCRNTRRIAETSFKPLRNKPKLFDSAINGTLPEMYFEDSGSVCATLDAIIKKYRNEEIKNIQILSCSTAGNSILSDRVEDDMYKPSKGEPVPFTTSRKFKGLEADVVIMVDVNADTLLDEAKVFYVASSRARLYLSILANLNENEAAECVKYLGSTVKKGDPKGTLAKLLGCLMIQK